MAPMSADERDTTLYAFGAVHELHMLGDWTWRQAEKALDSYHEAAEDGGDEAESSMLIAVVYADVLDQLHERLREITISPTAERYARAVDSRLEDVAAAIRAEASGDNGAAASAAASRRESDGLIAAALAVLVDELQAGAGG